MIDDIIEKVNLHKKRAKAAQNNYECLILN